MTRRPGAVLATLLLSALLLLATGCQLGTDDEMEPPTRTVTASPSPEVTAVPATVPVGRGVVSASDVVWAQGSRLHVGNRSVDLSPVAIDAFVSVPGGVYVLQQGELWYTDLTRLKGTGVTGVTDLGVTADGSRVLVTVATSGAGSAYAFDTATGRAVSSARRGAGDAGGATARAEPARRGGPARLRARRLGREDHLLRRGQPAGAAGRAWSAAASRRVPAHRSGRSPRRSRSSSAPEPSGSAAGSGITRQAGATRDCSRSRLG